ncbi:CBS domain-containing protein [Streptomyces sp. NRRL B-24484]|uniref:CBS domain-containing protein n=1 Tax=Streptomyces sp. NRRL B-24484 TaxID=1463833 RepID=UPI0006948ADA|nr:CBS domain-containing protein [Streptomyces sp. NRRL B-24484]
MFRLAHALGVSRNDLVDGRPDEPPRHAHAARRARLLRLTGKECRDRPGTHGVGRIALPGHHYPVVLPVNCTVDGRAVAHRTSDFGIAATAAGSDVGFQVDRTDLMHVQAVQDDPDEIRTVPRPEGDRATAAGLMSAPPVCITADAGVVAAARHMERNRVKHLPAVDADGLLVGTVSRADPVKAFLRDDRAIAEQIADEVLGGIDGIDPPPWTSKSIRDGSRSAAPSTRPPRRRSSTGCAVRSTASSRSPTGSGTRPK